MGNTWRMYGLKIGTTYIPIASESHDPRLEELLGETGDNMDPQYASLRGTMPILDFTTPALATALGVCGYAGKHITTGAVAVMYFALNDSTGPASGAVHMALTLNDGTMALQSISGDKNSVAMASYQIAATFDGINLPFVVTTNSSLDNVTNLAELFTAYALVLNYGESSSLQIPLNTGAFSTGATMTQQRGAADLHPTFSAILGYKPTLSFASAAIVSVASVLDLSALECTSAVLWFAKLDHGSGWKGSNDISITAAAGTAVMDTLSVTHNDVGSVSGTVYAVGNPAIAISTSGSKPSAEHLDELWTLGPAEFNSFTSSTTSLNIAVNNTVDHAGDSGLVDPNRASLMRRRPIVRVGVMDIEQLPIFGQAEITAVVWLRKIAAGSTRVSTLTAEHCKMTMAAAIAYQGTTRGGISDSATQEISLRPVQTGENEVIAFTTEALETE